MTAEHPAEVERESGATFLELFFDLVFVFAITQVTALIRQEGEVASFLPAALVFALVWWAWSQFTWVGNAVDMGDRWHRVVVLAATGSAFFMAQAVTDALGHDGEWFGVAYALTMLLGLGLYWVGLRHDRDHQRALLTYIPIAGPASLVVAVGGFLGTSIRPWVLAFALVLFGLSGLAAERGHAFRIAPRHFAERHALIVIIALGEAVIAVGIAAAGLERTAAFMAAIAVGVIGSLALWWAYFDWFQETAEERLRARPALARAAFARDVYTFGHYPLVFGIVAFAVAVEEAVAHPGEHLEALGRFGLAAGIVLYLAGSAAVYLRAGGILLVERIATAVVAVAVVVALPDLDAVAALGIVVGSMVVGLVLERIRHHAGALRLG